MKKKNLNKDTLIGKRNYKVSNFNHEWVLFHNEFSICSRKVRVCLEELSINYYSQHIHLIETKDCENLSNDFLKINPTATVPVLLHENYPIYESHEQIKYVSELKPGILYNDEIVEKWNEKGSLVGDDPMNGIKDYAGNCISIMMQPLFAAMLKKVSIFKFIKYFKHPSKFRAFFFVIFKLMGNRAFGKNAPNQRAAVRAFKCLKVHFDDLNHHLNDRIWIGGEKFSIADITWMVLFHRVEELQIIDLLIGNHENLKEYHKRLKNRESYKKSILEFNSEAISNGINQLKSDIKTSKNIIQFYQLIQEESKMA